MAMRGADGYGREHSPHAIFHMGRIPNDAPNWTILSHNDVHDVVVFILSQMLNGPWMNHKTVPVSICLSINNQN